MEKRSQGVINEVKKVIIGKDSYIEKMMCAILAGGHVLLDDVPGVGKTNLALSFAKAMNLKQNRMQFTPDVLPADLIGFSVYDKSTGGFTYHEGAVMCNLFLADEINRTSPKTQSALLEVMEEGSVTVDGITRELPNPFIVLATQNPVGSVGTQLLPESQLDRFMICMSLGYPELASEIRILKGKQKGNPLDTVSSVIFARDLIQMQREVDNIFIHDLLYDYIARLVQYTRKHPMIDLAVSPRGTIALAKMASAMAFLRERDFVVPSDVDDIFEEVAAHRIVLSPKARVNKISVHDVILDILEHVEKPSATKTKNTVHAISQAIIRE